MIDLEFDTLTQAEDLLAAMRIVWGRVECKIMMNPRGADRGGSGSQGVLRPGYLHCLAGPKAAYAQVLVE
jgi:hypothetical protein